MKAENKTNKSDYIELSRVPISSSRDVVISKRLKGGFTIGQQVLTKDENGEEKNISKGFSFSNDFNVDKDNKIYITWIEV